MPIQETHAYQVEVTWLCCVLKYGVWVPGPRSLMYTACSNGLLYLVV